MFIRVLYRFLPVFLALSFASVPSVPQSATGDFSIILFPDTQNEAQYFPQVLQAETQWVVNNRAALNIQAVLGLGDIVNDGADTAQQQNADSAIRTLDTAGVPYLLAIGNHDYDGGNPGATDRLVTGFNQWFGPTRYAAKTYYVGNFPSGSNENFYGVLTINGKQYLVLALEYIPRTTSLNWAASIVKANPDKEVIVVTHSYMFYDNTRVDSCDTQDLGGIDNNGELVWSSFAKKYPNVIMVVSGHITAGLAGRRADLGVNGNLVNQMLSNYQVLPNGGDGWLRILKFHPSSNTISVQTYSPYLNTYKTDSANQFTIYYHNPGSNGTGLGTISGRVRNSTCQSLGGLTVSAGGHSAVTDSNGKFAFSSLPTGQSYTVSVSGSGWKSASKTVGVTDNLAASPTQVDFFLTSSSMASCTPSTVNPSVTICSPAANATLGSPVRVIASTTDSNPVRFVEIWADGAKLYHALGTGLDTKVSLAAGLHQLTVQAYDGIGFIRKTISITVTSNPTVTVSPSSLSFVAQNVGSTSPAQAVQVTNNNTGAAVALSSVAVSGDFAQSNNCGSSIAAGASCAVNVTFTPIATGTRSGTLSLADSASNSPQTISLSGTGGTASSCTASTVNQTVTICTPTNGQTVSSPVHIVAKTTDSTPVQRLEVWVDGVKVYQVSGGSLTADVPIAAGVNHRLTVQAYDGIYFKTTIYITVQ